MFLKVMKCKFQCKTTVLKITVVQPNNKVGYNM